MPEERLATLAQQVQLLLMDVDGVLTDGQIVLAQVSENLVTETKSFDVTDGAGIAFAKKAGLRTGIITKRASLAVVRRANELGMDYVLTGVDDKRAALEEVCRLSGVPTANTCYIGDDLPDLPVLTKVGFPVAVRNARPEVQAIAAYVTEALGGRGAVREVVELILKAQDRWNSVVDLFLK